MAGQEWYKEWFNSPFYHKLYFERDEEEARNFINKLVDHLHPVPGSRMLDVACGRGRHSKILAEKDFFVTGIDLSPVSILYAKQFEKNNLEFFQHDMRLPFRVNYYDYAFNLFTSFGYFITRREHENAIRTITNSLKSNGTFVIDYLNVHYVEEHFVPKEEKVINGTLYQIRRWQDETHFYKKIVIRDISLFSHTEYTEKVAKYSLGDFNDMLAYHHLQIDVVFGDYQLNSYNVRKTPRLIIVAKKKQ